MVYASRSMSKIERRYAQIEREPLAVTWTCERFTEYILGRKFTIEIDHKSLIPLLNTKQFNSLSPRVLGFRLRLAKFDYKVQYVPGKYLYTADTLSQAPLPKEREEEELQGEVEAFVNCVTEYAIPATEQRLETYQNMQKLDPICCRVREYCQSGLSTSKKFLELEITPYYQARHRISECNGLLMYCNRILVPKAMQKEMQKETLDRIHTGHQGIERCRACICLRSMELNTN